MNRVDRLLALILFLQSKRVTTAEEMSRHFELSVRTIYRDLAALGEAGVPVAAEAGVGYSLMKGYHLPPVSFTTTEASALVTGGVLVEQFTDASLRTQMHSALLKVRAILPRERQDQLARLERGLATSAITKLPAQADLCLLQQALAQMRVLRFHYQGAGKTEASERIVEPLGLVYYLERWHLIAWCRSRNDYRDFRTDRMSKVETLGESFGPREEFSIAEFIRDTTPAATLKARVKFASLSADRARREWWLGVVAEQQVKDGVILTLATDQWERLTGWLLSFGGAITVLAPAKLRRLVISAAEDAATHHRNNAGGKVS
jgi:predicted DNA-binding transcriptional regulator YafY